MLQKAPVVAPVIGATKSAHLEDAVKSVDVQLGPDDIAYMEEPYVPHPLVGLIPYGEQLLSSRR
jgi:aryl-alcohol dehydrogenase-like predicted oxidoreductase